MNSQPAGPSGNAGWVARQAGSLTGTLPGSPDGTLSLLVLPDAALADLYYALPATPRLAYDTHQRPVFGLTLVLRERPAPGADTIFPLVEAGTLTCDLTLALPETVLSDKLKPLFARAVAFALQADAADPGAPGPGAPALATATGNGAGARVGLAVQLDQVAAQGVLKAINGAASGLTLTCRVTYRVAESRRVVHLAGRLRAVYDALHTHAPASGLLRGGELQARLMELVDAHTLRAWIVQPNGIERAVTAGEGADVLAALLKVSGGMLRRMTPAPAEAEPAYELGAPPSDAAAVDIRLGVTSGGEAHVDLDAPLEDILGGALTGQPTDTLIRLTYLDPQAPGGRSIVPQRVRNSPATKEFPNGQRSSLGMTMVGDSLVATARALSPDRLRMPPAAAMLITDAASRQTANSFILDDGVMALRKRPRDEFEVDFPDIFVDPPPDPDPIPPDPPPPDPVAPPPNLPVVADAAAPLWVDAADANQFWYAPEIGLAPVDPGADPEQSTFLFRFHEAGHDSQGRTVLEGEIRFTLQRSMSAATAAALQAKGNPPAREVPVNDLAVTLTLPVRDTAGVLQHVDLPGSVTVNGTTIAVTVAVLNEYVRVAYGDLAIANFQPEQARLRVSFTFPSAHWSPGIMLKPDFVDKIAWLPIVPDDPGPVEMVNFPYLNAGQLTYRTPVASMAFRREAAFPAEAANGLRDATGMRAMPAQRNAALAAFQSAKAMAKESGTLPIAAFAVADTNLLIQPALYVDPGWQLGLIGEWLVQTIARTTDVAAFFPCNTLGAFYRQDLGDRQAAIGCQDSLTLGQAPLRLYELVDDPAVASDQYRVYRSLCQPGRFMVAPTTYVITRFAPSEGDRAYRPIVYLYSSLDPTNRANQRCVVVATLEPDLSPWQRKELTVTLGRLHHSPVVQYITELDAQVAYTWSITGGVANIQPQATRIWDSFQVTLATDLAGGLQLQNMLMHTGLAAQATFTLADGNTVATNLVLDLGRIGGPWDGGPVAVAVQGTSATLTNRIDGGVNVSDLHGYAAGGERQVVPVDRQLAPGTATVVTLPFAAAEVYPVTTLQPGDPASLTEINSFVENIHTNVVFVNLIHYANHNLRQLTMQARMRDLAGSETNVALSEEQPASQAAFLLPLTAFLGTRMLQFQVTKIDTAGNVTITPWLEWDLATQGSVISLTWELIA